jgi:alginate O-acetyltransferase complex protein AlgI
MLFNTIEFVIFFIVVVTTIGIVKNRKFQHLFILAAGYVFFYYTSNYYITLLIFTTLWDYYLGKAIYQSTTSGRKKIFLIISLSVNLGLLGFFKYADFAITQFNVLGNYVNLSTHIPLLNLALPIGISFYTFHSVGYIIDVYRGHIPPSKSLREYALFIAFFPQLVAGPILRAGQFLPQLREKISNTELKTRLSQILIEKSNLKIGITMMALGFFKKMFFADNLAPMVYDVFHYPLGLDSFTIILGTLSFGVQVYCDFSGYSDIAIGAALIMGFKIPPNFNKPFFATSTSEFWRRWHISLSSWVKDYLFLPILYRNLRSDARLFFGLLLTFFLLGLWHGAGWNFIIFGLLHGMYVALDAIIRKKIPSLRFHPFFKTKVGTILSILGTQYLVFLAWIPFRVKDNDFMLYSLQKYILIDFHLHDTIRFISEHKFPMLLLITFVILHFISYKKKTLPEKISNFGMKKWTIFLIVIMLLIVYFFDGHPSDFVYFRF